MLNSIATGQNLLIGQKLLLLNKDYGIERFKYQLCLLDVMTAINYDGNEFYEFDFQTKERTPIPIDQLPEEFNPGEHIFFDYNTQSGGLDGLTFFKPVTRDELVAECERAYRNPDTTYHKNKLFAERHLAVDTICKENIQHPSKLRLLDIHPTKLDLTPVKCLDRL